MSWLRYARREACRLGGPGGLAPTCPRDPSGACRGHACKVQGRGFPAAVFGRTKTTRSSPRAVRKLWAAPSPCRCTRRLLVLRSRGKPRCPEPCRWPSRRLGHEFPPPAVTGRWCGGCGIRRRDLSRLLQRTHPHRRGPAGHRRGQLAAPKALRLGTALGGVRGRVGRNHRECIVYPMLRVCVPDEIKQTAKGG